jgi:glucarate dehydratase
MLPGPGDGPAQNDRYWCQRLIPGSKLVKWYYQFRIGGVECPGVRDVSTSWRATGPEAPRSMSATIISAIRATPVTVPLAAPLLHSNGAHWGRFVRTIVEVETDDGYVGLGEMGGGGDDATRGFAALEGYLRGHDVFRLEAMRFAICNPTASLYNNRTQLHAAIEFACLDIMGQKLGAPVHALLGGKLRDSVEFASYLFFRYNDPVTGRGEVRTVEQLVTHARALAAEHGFRVHKLKGGVYPPEHELACYRALADAFPGDRFRYDPNSALSLADAIDFGRGIEDLRNDYFEDPVWGLPQLARLKEFVPIPIATNTVVVNFEQLAANVEMRAVDVVLLDTTFWGGIRPCIKAAGVCETMGIGVAVHSSGELGIQLATMLHLGAVIPNLGYAADAHYHHLTDDVIVGGRMAYKDGAIRVPDGNGLGVALDREKLAQYHELYRRQGSYAYDRDPGRPGWYPLVPNRDWADPSQSLTPKLGGG